MSGETLDPNIHPYRPDLAAAYLEGKVEAERFVEGWVMQVADEAAPVFGQPRFDAEMTSEALHGETVTVFEEREGWAWGQVNDDGYVGYLPANALTADCVDVSHRVAVPRTFVFPKPDIKSVPMQALGLRSGLNVIGEEGSFVRTHGGGFVYRNHVRPADAASGDFVAVAHSLLGAPYLWGGKSILGIDCSGLVQIALQACGMAVPRDSYMLRADVGQALGHTEISDLQLGDLLFWPGHVGLMTDDVTMLHANAHHMMTVTEPVAEAASRIAAAGSELLQINRL